MQKTFKTITLVFIFVCFLLAACSNPSGGGNTETGTITINLSSSTSRATTGFPETPMDMNDLTYKIKLTPVSSGSPTERVVNGSANALITISPGSWNITVYAYRDFLTEPTIYGIGKSQGGPIEVKANQNTSVSIIMERPISIDLDKNEAIFSPLERTSKTIVLTVYRFEPTVPAPSVGLDIDKSGLTNAKIDIPIQQQSPYPDTKIFEIKIESDPPGSTPSGNFVIKGITGLPSGYANMDEQQVIPVKFHDGLTENTPIPVNQSNIATFNSTFTTDMSYLSKHYFLEEDIITWSGSWTPIGDAPSSNAFTGTFDGRNGIITDINFSGSPDYLGMFGAISSTAEIKNLNLYSVIFDNTSPAYNSATGGLVGHNNGKIENCSVTGTIDGPKNVGGLVGFNNSKIIKCSADVNVIGNDNVGGLVGNTGTTPSSIENCYATGAVDGSTGDNFGGLVGLNAAKIINCYASGDVIYTSGNYAGGIAGQNFGGTINSCVSLCANISGSGPDSGQIVGGPGGLSNNYAASGTGTDPDDKDGKMITSSEYEEAAWWKNTVGFSASIWDFENWYPPSPPMLKKAEP